MTTSQIISCEADAEISKREWHLFLPCNRIHDGFGKACPECIMSGVGKWSIYQIFERGRTLMNELIQLIQDSKYLVALTGAGMSTESGLPDFRSQGGLWCGKDPNEIATPKAIGTEDFFEFYQMRIEELFKYHPNIGHYVLAELEKEGILKAVLTQNIDGFHQQAGNRKVVEIHGHMRYLVCSRCDKEYPAFSYCEGTYYCTDDTCKAPLRPPIVLFGEPLDSFSWHSAIQEVERADTVVVLGTSLQVYPFAGLVEIAHETGAKVIIINRTTTPLDYLAEVTIHESIGKVLSEVVKTVLGSERIQILKEKTSAARQK